MPHVPQRQDDESNEENPLPDDAKRYFLKGTAPLLVNVREEDRENGWLSVHNLPEDAPQVAFTPHESNPNELGDEIPEIVAKRCYEHFRGRIAATNGNKKLVEDAERI